MSSFNTKIFILIFAFVPFFLSKAISQCAAKPSSKYVAQIRQNPSSSAEPTIMPEQIAPTRKSPPKQTFFEAQNQCFGLNLHFMHDIEQHDEEKWAAFKQGVLLYLNDKFRDAHIEFYIERVTTSDLPNFHAIQSNNKGQLRQLCQGDRYNHKGINIYVVDKILSDSGEDEAGHALFPDNELRLNAVFIRIDNINNVNTIAHELGHFFGLLHTHECAGMSTDEAGNDGINDTEPDPYEAVINGKHDPCNFPNFKYQGRNYRLPTDNLMSYYLSCNHPNLHFSPKQLAYMTHVSITQLKRLRRSRSRQSKVMWYPFDAISIDALKTDARYRNYKKAFVLVAHERITWCDRMLEEMDKDAVISAYFLNEVVCPILIYPEQMGEKGLNDFLGNIHFREDNIQDKSNLLFKYLSPEKTFYPALLIIDIESKRVDYFKFSYKSPLEIREILRLSLKLQRVVRN